LAAVIHRGLVAAPVEQEFLVVLAGHKVQVKATVVVVVVQEQPLRERHHLAASVRRE
jgi:hypothetical protein